MKNIAGVALLKGIDFTDNFFHKIYLDSKNDFQDMIISTQLYFEYKGCSHITLRFVACEKVEMNLGEHLPFHQVIDWRIIEYDNKIRVEFDTNYCRNFIVVACKDVILEDCKR